MFEQLIYWRGSLIFQHPPSLGFYIMHFRSQNQWPLSQTSLLAAPHILSFHYCIPNTLFLELSITLFLLCDAFSPSLLPPGQPSRSAPCLQRPKQALHQHPPLPSWRRFTKPWAWLRFPSGWVNVFGVHIFYSLLMPAPAPLPSTSCHAPEPLSSSSSKIFYLFFNLSSLLINSYI